ncbi:MAG: peptidoglycan DD-metalloendopeptidase family protein [Sulfurimonas sp.]|nr:peptidoglycan DD-metalloendopeptidase family protein [Sulfurimonas sp.]
MLRFFILFLLCASLFGAEVERYRWINGETYLVFLEKNNLPTKELYYNLDTEDQRLTEELLTGINYQVAKSAKGEIEQILLPLNDELQIHIYKEEDKYKFEAIPIIATTETETFSVIMQQSPIGDIVRETGSKKLAQIFATSFKNSLNFKTGIKPGDTLVMIYEQKYRLGKPFSIPSLKAAMVEVSGKKNFIYLNDDEKYYDEKGSQAEEFLLGRPIAGARMTSPFTKKRFHPVLKKWKAHLGIDYGARPGTPVFAAGDGFINYAANAGSYGNLIRISHTDGFETRYAHLKSFKNGVRKGKNVKKGEVIAYVGTTGRSTGPHLHFELRKKGVAINPLNVVQVATVNLQGKQKAAFDRLAKNYNEKIESHLNNKPEYQKPRKTRAKCYFYNETPPPEEEEAENS